MWATYVNSDTKTQKGKDLSLVKDSFKSVPLHLCFEFCVNFSHWLAKRFQNRFGEERF